MQLSAFLRYGNLWSLDDVEQLIPDQLGLDPWLSEAGVCSVWADSNLFPYKFAGL